MSYFDFPHARNYDSDLSFLIEQYQKLLNKVEELIGKIDEGDVATLQDLNNAIAPILQQIQELNATIAPITQQITQLSSSIPTKTSQLTNDSDFVNSTTVNTAISTAVNPISQQLQEVEGNIPTTTSQLTNNSNFVVGATVANIVVESGSHTGSDANTLYFVLEA